MGVEVKGEQGLGELPEEGLEDDSWQVQVILAEVHRQPWGWGRWGEELGPGWRPAVHLAAKDTPLPDFPPRQSLLPESLLLHLSPLFLYDKDKGIQVQVIWVECPPAPQNIL